MINQRYKLDQQIMKALKNARIKISCEEKTKDNSTLITFHIKKIHENTVKKKHCIVYIGLKPTSKLRSHIISQIYVHSMVHKKHPSITKNTTI
jgi:hypothetical protein